MIKVDSTSKTIFEGIGKMIDAMVTDYGKFNYGHNTNKDVADNMFNEYKDDFEGIYVIHSINKGQNDKEVSKQTTYRIVHQPFCSIGRVPAVVQLCWCLTWVYLRGLGS